MKARVRARALPIAEEFGDELLHLGGVELSADDDLSLAGPVELLVVLARVVEGEFVEVLEAFVDGGGVAHVAAGVLRVHVSVHLHGGQG